MFFVGVCLLNLLLRLEKMSIIQVTGSSKKSVGNRSLFTGARLPPDIKSMVKSLNNLKREPFRKLLKIAVADLEGKDLDIDGFKDVLTDSLTEDILATVYSGLYSLLVLALRIPLSSLKEENFKEDLQELKIPEEFIQDISSAVFGAKRTSLDEQIIESRPRLPQLVGFKWRVDVGISTSSLNRLLEPTVTMETLLSNGEKHNFEVPMVKFHELRYNVAHVLKDMEDLEKHSILKIQD